MKKQLCVLIILAVDIFGIWLCFGLAVVLKNLLYGDSVLLDVGRYQGFAPSYVIMIFFFFYQGIYSRRWTSPILMNVDSFSRNKKFRSPTVTVAVPLTTIQCSLRW